MIIYRFKSILFLFFFTPGLSQNKGIKFENNIHWQDILDKAKMENKHVFVYCFATWCGPCKYMSDEVFPKEEVGRLYNEKYINVKLQFDSTDEDSEEIRFQYEDAVLINKKYDISGYPSYLFFNSNGELVHRDFGGSDEKEFIAKGTAALDPENQYYTQLKKYESGLRDASFLKSLALLALRSQEATATAKFANAYISSTPQIIHNKDDLQFIHETTRTTKDTGFSLMMNHLNKFEAVISKQQLNNTLTTIIRQSEFADHYLIWDSWNKNEWDSYSNLILKKYPPFAEQVLFEIKTTIFQSKNSWSNYVNLIEEYMAGNTLTDDQLNEYAWNLFKNCNEIRLLKTALKWSKKSFEKHSKIEPGYVDTYANLLYKIGKRKEALKWELKAQKIAIEGGAEKNWGQEVIDKITRREKTW